MFCVYCGKPTDFVHQPICFKDGIAYRWLLESLDLDGSEMVEPPTRRRELNRGPNASKEEIPLSDLLDFKIQWRTEAEKKGDGSANKEPDKTNSITFKGVDLDNFFSKWSDPSSVPEGSSLTRNIGEASDYQADASHHRVSLFESVQPSESVVPTSDEKQHSSFSGWKADFQTSGDIGQARDLVSLGHSGHQQELSKVSDPVSRTAQDLPSGLSSAFGPSENFKEEKEKTNPAAPPLSGEGMSEDLWANLTSAVPQQTTLTSDKNVQAHKSAPHDNLSNLSTGLDWFQADPMPVNDLDAPTNSMEDKNSDMFDDWNDFTSSTGFQASSQDAITASHDQSIVFLEEMVQSNLFSSERDDKELDLSSLLQTGPSYASVSKETNQIMNSFPSEATFLDSFRVVASGSEDTNQTGQPAAEKDAKSTSSERNQDVEQLISKMHDLSFMLENKLSLPSKSDGHSLLP